MGLIELFEYECGVNDEAIKGLAAGSKTKLKSKMILIKGAELEYYEFDAKHKEKETFKRNITNIALTTPLTGYVVVVPEYTYKKKGVSLLMRAAFSPEQKVVEFVWHKDNTIICKQRISGRHITSDALNAHTWDAWPTKILLTVNLDKKGYREVDDYADNFVYKKKK